MKSLMCLFAALLTSPLFAGEPISIWPDMAPGETTKATGEKQPYRKNEVPPVTRVIKITQPTMTVHLADKPNGSAVLILPGGGFIKVVPDKEGTEAADWLNKHGVSAFVLSYRTKNNAKDSGWAKALQDSQRALSLIRSKASDWGLKKDRIGLLGFSAGGQVAARHLCSKGKIAYDKIDDIDEVSHRPDFALLIYPWNVYDVQRKALIQGVQVPKDCPPTYIAHTDDDRSSSLGAVLFYVKLKQFGISSELHVYGNGGHGYGMRPVNGSQIASWTDHAAHWIGTRGFLE